MHTTKIVPMQWFERKTQKFLWKKLTQKPLISLKVLVVKVKKILRMTHCFQLGKVYTGFKLVLTVAKLKSNLNLKGIEGSAIVYHRHVTAQALLPTTVKLH